MCSFYQRRVDGLTEERLIKSFVWRVFLVGGESVIN